MQIRSFERAFELTDYTQEITSIPNTWGLINELGFFRNESVSQHSITVESKQGTLAVLTDMVRGARATVSKDHVSSLRSFPIPHFPFDDYVSPQDIQGRRMYGTPDQAETEANVIATKLARLRQAHAVTLEVARAYALTTGAIYAPNGTVAGNYYTDFGVTKKVVDFVLGTATTDVISKNEEVIAHIQDNILSGESVTNIIVLASPEWFNKYVNQAGVKEAYKYYQSTQEPLRNRLASGMYRRFVHGGLEIVEYRGSYNGTPLIPSGKAYAIPQGTQDMFVSYFSPANKFSHVNTLGEQVYAFSTRDLSDEKITLQTESNALHLVRRPQAVVELTSSN